MPPAPLASPTPLRAWSLPLRASLPLPASSSFAGVAVFAGAVGGVVGVDAGALGTVGVGVADDVAGAVGVGVAGSGSGSGSAEVPAGVAVAEVAVTRVGSAGDSVAIVTSYRMIDRNDHTWAGWVRDMVYVCFP